MTLSDLPDLSVADRALHPTRQSATAGARAAATGRWGLQARRLTRMRRALTGRG